MSATRIKFCGITRQEDAAAAVDLGVDALGFVFYPQSPRCVSPEQAAAICAGLPPFVTRVGLFVNAAPDFVNAVAARCALDLVQFHGDETPVECTHATRPWIRALRIRPGDAPESAFAQYAQAAGLLFDAYNPDMYGGSGQSFDWSMVPAERPLPVILAGGLTPQNVAHAIREVRPYAVDVSGGIEREKGIKDPARMNDFVSEVRRLERSN